MGREAAPAEASASVATRPPLRRYLAVDRVKLGAFALGCLTVGAFAPLYLFPLPLVTLAILMRLWRRAESPRRAAALGWWFGLGLFLTGVSWVYVSLHTFGAMPLPLAALFTLLFCAFLALFPAATAYVSKRLAAPAWLDLALFMPAAWTVSEWIRSWIFTGFPWLAMGYSQVPSGPLAGLAPVAGIYAVSFAVLASAGLLVLLWDRTFGAKTTSAAPSPEPSKRARRAALPLLALMVVWGGAYALKTVRWTEPSGQPIDVTLLQGNIPQEIKWTVEGLRTTLRRYRSLALASSSKLIVFPETAIPLFLHDVPDEYLAEIGDHARRNGGDALLGIPERLDSGEYYNSVISLGAAPNQSYRKFHLVPFGEYIPLRPVLGWLVSVLAIPLQDFSRGSTHQRPLEVAGQRVAMNICYEDVFGEEIIRQLPAATLLVNISNVAWFGRSVAPYQHLQISQARALETGRYMLRATNTGMTGVVNERGEIVEVAPQFETASVTQRVQGYSGATPYVRVGNAPAIGLCVALLALGVIARRRALA